MASLALSADVFVDWDIGYVMVNRDGYNTRRAIGVNGKLPIPPVEATIGDTVYMHVHNSLDKPTSIHAHGLFQNGTNAMDGPAFVSQCPIPPGESFTYVYKLVQSGTYWIHGHTLHQNSDGLRSPFIIYNGADVPYDYDNDILLYFEDWFKEEFAERFAVSINSTPSSPPPHGYGFGLINGYNGNDTQPLYFEPNKTYWIRLINMGSLDSFKFIDLIDIAPAQRYSVLVKSHSTVGYNYRYNATMHADFIPTTRRLNPRVYMGDIIYDAKAPFKPVYQINEAQIVQLDDIYLSSLDGEPVLPVDRSIELVIGDGMFSNGQHLDTLNDISYKESLVPSLFTALSMGSLAMDPQVYGPQSNAHVLRYNEVIELVIHNPSNLPHPFHLHGHAFQITEYGLSDKNVPGFPLPDPLPQTLYAQAAPIKRDTMVIPPNQYIKLRFKANNPGVWFFHCHLDVHAALGMAQIFVEAPDILQRTQNAPSKMYEFCIKQGIPISGNAAGNRGLDFTGMPPPPTPVPRNATSS
ncbi:ferroxidase fet3 [Coemansia spiralis]|uniref:Ferroxidase fet3 n=1 Tax=Coemansia spiralis TaxID=417178 RepID=A0A9W8L055_9FUNG|nr:ferroxidase fet3 [Coemansia sp. RSA 1358]KAJ2679296.1 ferroxidase fet3 [Coemansia spiralis]